MQVDEQQHHRLGRNCQGHSAFDALYLPKIRGIFVAAGTISQDVCRPAYQPVQRSTPPDDRLGRFLSEHAVWLRQVIRARTGEPQAVDEVWQQVALAAVEQRSPLADPAKVAPWLHRLAIVLSARYRRKQGWGCKALAHLAERACRGLDGDPLSWLLRRP